MPVLNQVTTKDAKPVWKSPDGQRVLFEVTLSYQGNDFKAKTYSSDISVVGWAGDVTTEEKPGKFGLETFVKQPPKEGGFTPSGGGSKPSFKGGDQFTMYLSYAKDLAVACVVDGKFNDKVFAEMLGAVSAGGEQLYEARPDAKPAEKTEDLTAGLEEIVDDVTQLSIEDTPWADNPTT